jgi:small redox-active disulfide protein 2
MFSKLRLEERREKMEIKILGPGCARCNATEKVVMDVLAETDVDANVEKVTDLMKIAEYGVFGTPAVVIDGQVKCVGKIPKKEDVKSWIKG